MFWYNHAEMELQKRSEKKKGGNDESARAVDEIVYVYRDAHTLTHTPFILHIL